MNTNFQRAFQHAKRNSCVRAEILKVVAKKMRIFMQNIFILVSTHNENGKRERRRREREDFGSFSS